MKKTLLTLSVSALSMSAFAQITTIQWAQCYGGTSQDNCNHVSQTADSGYIACGSTTSSDGEVTGLHALSADFWVTKISATGALQWEECLGGSNTDDANSILQTFDGGYAVAGRTNSADGDVTGNHGLNDFWIVKLNATGGIHWEKCLGGSNNDACNAMVQTADSGFVLVGYSQSTDGDVTLNHGLEDVWVVKLDDTGGIQWQHSFGGSGDDYANAVQQTRDGGYIVAGTTLSTDGDITINHGNSDCWVLKLSSTGALQWQKTFGGNYGEVALSIKQTIDGGYIFTGGACSTDTMGGEVTGHHGANNVSDMWTVKIDDTGAIEWEKSLGGSGIDVGYSVIQTADSGYMSFGYANFSTDSTASDGNVTNPFGYMDYWLVKLSPSGDLIEEKTFGGSGNEYPASVIANSDGSITLGGTSHSTDDEVTGNYGYTDFWVVKLQSCSSLSVPVINRTGNELSTTAVSSATYQWTINGIPIAGATNASYTSITAGSYAVTVTTSAGCESTSAATLISSGVNPLYNTTTISMFPNPTTGDIFIDGIANITIKVHNPIGQLLKEEPNTNNISIAEFPSGIYFVGLYSDQGELLKQEKIIKN